MQAKASSVCTAIILKKEVNFDMVYTNATVSMRTAAKRLMCLIMTLAIMMSVFTFLAAASAETSVGTTNAKVVLRKEADKESKALQTLPEGEEVNILSTSGSWYKVGYGSFSGYIMKKYITKGSAAASKNADQIKALGSAPGIMRIGDETSDVLKLQKALDILGYYSGKLDGKYGDGTATAVKKYQKDHNLEADGYAGKATVTSIFGICSSTSLTTQPEPGSTSASSASSSSKDKTVDSIAAIGSAPAKCEEGDSGTNVVKIQQALEYLGYYDGAIDGRYGAATVAAVKAFQSKRGMKADGIAGESTIRVIFGESAASTSSSAKYKTEVLDWYADNVSKVIPKKARFTVKDVATGKTFQMVRWSGGDHMDAEPYTDDDTATIKSIYGGSFSWRRRAILILYKDHVYAASMNGMPHGTTTISSNDFDGHLCIHFKNSKTHGSDKVDPDHQNAVEKASKATW